MCQKLRDVISNFLFTSDQSVLHTTDKPMKDRRKSSIFLAEKGL